MNAVAERGDESDTRATPNEGPSEVPSEAQLLDVLYELLAQGINPRTSPSRAEVEQFLHEHARERKSEEEMLCFFTLHGLPTDASAIGADVRVSELAAGLQRERGSVPPRGEPASERDSHPSLTRPRVPREADDDVGDDEITAQRTMPRPPASAAASVSVSAMRGQLVMPLAMMAVAATLGLSAAFYLTHQRASALELELSAARDAERAAAGVRGQLEQTAERLQRALDESERALRAEASRAERAHAEQEKRRRLENLALQRVLGPHYNVVKRRLDEALAKSGL